MASIEDDFPLFQELSGTSTEEEDDDSMNLFWRSKHDWYRGKLNAIRLKACFLRVLSNFVVGTGQFQGLLMQFRTVFQNVDQDLQKCGLDFNKFLSGGYRLIPVRMDDLISCMLQRLERLDPDIKQFYDNFSSEPFSDKFIMNREAFMKNLNFLLKNVKYLMKSGPGLVASLKEKLEASLTSLQFLRNFVGFTVKGCSSHELSELKDLVNHAGFLVGNMSCLLYLCCSINDEMMNEMKMQLSSELHRFSPAHPRVREMYIKALKASKSEQGDSTVVDEYDLDFLVSLQANILELSDNKLSFMASNKDQILSLHEELRVLTIPLAMYGRQGAQLYQMSKHISCPIIDMGCLIYELHNNNEQNIDKAEVVKKAIYDLQESLKIARKVYKASILIPKSWHYKTKYRSETSNPQGTIRSLIRKLDTIKGHNSSYPRRSRIVNINPSRDLDKVLQKEIQSLIWAFSTFISRQHHENEEVEVEMILLNKIRNKTENVISSFPNRVSDKRLFMNFILIEEIKMIKLQLDVLQNQMIHGSSNYTDIFEDEEADQLGEQLIDESEGMRGIHTEQEVCPTYLDLYDSHIKAENLKVLLTGLFNEFHSANQDIQRFLSDLNDQISPSKCCCLPMNMEHLLSSMLSRLSDEVLIKNLNALLENIDVLLKCDAQFIAPLDEELEGVSNSMEFLRNSLSFTANWCNETWEPKDLISRAELLAGSISCLLYLCCNNERMGDEIRIHFSSMLRMFSPTQTYFKETRKKVSDLNVKEAARKIYELCVPKSLLSNFPRTNAQGFIGSLIQKLKELLDTKADVLAPSEHHIEIVQKELISLRDDFGKLANQPSYCKELQSLWTRFVDNAYQTEYIIDSFLAKDLPLYCHKLGLLNVIADIKEIKIEIKAMDIKITDGTSVQKSSNQVSLESNLHKNNADEKSEVIFGKEADEIRVQLTSGLPKLNIISIVGMPGIGKTTLADSVFQSVSFHFNVCARCSVSHVHDKNRLLLEILQQVSSKQYSYDDDDLDQRLYRSLKGRRYLVLMDDIWDIRHWKDIKESFPDDENGSRIIFTSRFQDIATQAGLESIKYHLSPLSKEKSWEMLEVKLFGNKSYPSELVSIGREIATNCKGLPLTIDVVAGILRVKERNKWKKVAENLMTLLFEDPEGTCRKVVELSYHNLPDNLKPCFLYFAAFPEDEDVPTTDLILLWIAEGFVQLEEGDLRSLEDVAEDILNNLISRSLVTVSKRRPLGGAEASHVHDLLHEFVVAKAQEESFMLKIDGKAENSTLSSVSIHDKWREQYRLCIYQNNWRQFIESNPSGPRTRALISFFAPYGYSSSLNFRAFKLLHVLYIPKVRSKYCAEIFTLIHLRVLAIDTFPKSDATKIMSGIHQLVNLESFIMDRTLSWKAHECLLLDKICKMVRLRHFCFGGYISFRYHSQKMWEMSSLYDNLRTLYHLRASYEEDIEKILKLMPNLVELKALFYCPDGYNRHADIYHFPKMDFLKKLEALEVTHQGNYTCKIVNINFPPYLKKLVLSKFCMQWKGISKIGNLESLEILVLKHGDFKGQKWEMADGEFPKLKYLSLYELDIKEWYASEDHHSCLEQLHIEDCRKLQELPSYLEEIATLRVIKLSHCTMSLENSANRIKEEQEETGNEQLVVEIR